MALTLTEVKQRIDAVFEGYHTATTSSPVSVLPANLQKGKVYEAWVLAIVLQRLADREGYTVRLNKSRYVVLKSGPGPINRDYPYFTLTKPGHPPCEVWTDVEFLALSYARRGRARGNPTPGDYHELDIVMVLAGTDGRPRHSDLILGVECKATSMKKHLLRAIIGVRRELSLLAGHARTPFGEWPRPSVPADPPSCLLFFSIDPAVKYTTGPGDAFGIDFYHEPLP